MFRIFRYAFSFVMLFLAVNDNFAQSGSGTWCPIPPPETCEDCTHTITSNAGPVTSDGGTICFEKDDVEFTFTGGINVQNDSEDVGTTICIGEGVTIDRNNLNGLNGNWTIYNYGTIELSSDFTIGSSQTFYNYGTFEIEDGHEFIIEEGGFYCNSGETFVGDNLINWGTMYSSGYIYVGDEFRNNTTGEAYITELFAEDDITNTGVIFLEGVIETPRVFDNKGLVKGLPNLCNAINAGVKVENEGSIDGPADGPIVIGVIKDNYIGDEDEPALIGDVVFADTPGLSEDCFRILPVEWSEFDVIFSASERTIMINWATLKEWDNSHFEIERSYLGVDDWEMIGDVKGAGYSDSKMEYYFSDTQLPAEGGLMYYRLRQVDIDGKSSVSKVLSLNIPFAKLSKGVWDTYPNPTDGNQLQVSLMDRRRYNDEVINFRIIHLKSSTMPISVTSVIEMNEMISQMVGNIPKGIFILEIQWGRNVEHLKVLHH